MFPIRLPEKNAVDVFLLRYNSSGKTNKRAAKHTSVCDIGIFFLSLIAIRTQ